MNVVLYCHTPPRYVDWLHVAYLYITSIFQQSQEALLADLFFCSPIDCIIFHYLNQYCENERKIWRQPCLYLNRDPIISVLITQRDGLVIVINNGIQFSSRIC